MGERRVILWYVSGFLDLEALKSDVRARAPVFPSVCEDCSTTPGVSERARLGGWYILKERRCWFLPACWSACELLTPANAVIQLSADSATASDVTESSSLDKSISTTSDISLRREVSSRDFQIMGVSLSNRHSHLLTYNSISNTAFPLSAPSAYKKQAAV